MSILIRITVHPHTCGVYSSMLQSRAAFCGPSPRARGLRPAQRWSCHPPSVHPHARRVYDPEWPCRLRQDRSIPTYVGFTIGGSGASRRRPVHPHIRGVYTPLTCEAGPPIGPSPHTWGLQGAGCKVKEPSRSIPTYVGFTGRRSPGGSPSSVHPHIRGVYALALDHTPDTTGPSPHTWGLRSDLPAPPCPSAVHPHIRGVFSPSSL